MVGTRLRPSPHSIKGGCKTSTVHDRTSENIQPRYASPAEWTAVCNRPASVCAGSPLPYAIGNQKLLLHHGRRAMAVITTPTAGFVRTRLQRGRPTVSDITDPPQFIRYGNLSSQVRTVFSTNLSDGSVLVHSAQWY